MTESFVLNKAFCCPGFQDAIEEAGHRGIAAVVAKTSVGILFLLQSRGIAFDDVSKLVAPAVNINVSSDIGFRYCPWCGKELTELVEAAPKVFDELAEKHQKLLPKGFVTKP